MVKHFAIVLALSVSACASGGGVLPTPEQLRKETVQSLDIKLGEQLECVGQSIPRIRVTVAKIPDLTGKVTISDGGDGAYVSQGARWMAMSALERMPRVTVMNTANFEVERIIGARVGRAAPWPKAPTAYFSGAITRIDFVPGAAIEGGIGPVQLGAREHGVVIGADLFLTRYADGRVLESASVEISLKGNQLKLALADMLGDRFATAGVDARRRAALQIGTETLVRAGLLQLLTPLARGACSTQRDYKS